MRAQSKRISQPGVVDMDIRKTALYAEVEEIYRTIYKPGGGRVVNGAEPRVSPDGRLVAFSGVMLEKLDGAPTTRICLLDRHTGLRVVTFGPGTDCSPAFSPDGRTVAFRSDRERLGDFQVYLLDVATGETRATAMVEGWVEYFAFSPDGLRLLLGVAGHGADVAGAQGAKASERQDDRAAWMPDVEAGDEAFRRRSVWLLDIVSGAARRVSPATLNVWEACWCGDDAIAAVATPGCAEEDW